jgi:hypothetical protein
LAVPLGDRVSAGVNLRNPILSSAFSTERLGEWALDAKVLNFLEHVIRQTRPRAVLEFGSGVGTVCIARYMYELHGLAEEPVVYSIEQDELHVEHTRRLLRNLGLERVGRVIHAPLKTQFIENTPTRCYDLSGERLREALGHVRPDFVIVDGPAGEDGVRFGTVPLAREWVSDGAMLFLDDALRDSELQTSLMWLKLPYVSIEGIHLLGKGLLAGTVRTQ